MGGQSSSLASAPKLREAILLKLHHHFKDRSQLLHHVLLQHWIVYDTKKTGLISREQFCKALHTMGLYPKVDAKKVSLVMECFDFKGDGMFDYIHFLAFLRPPGTEQWTIEAQIENCSIYQVFKAKRKRDETFLMIKSSILHKDMRMVLKIQLQIENLKLLRHINLLSFRGSLLKNNEFNIVQEWTTTCTLAATLEAFGPMDERTIRRYIRQALHGLVYLHTMGHLHRFINDETMYIDSAGLLQLGEFEIGSKLVQCCRPCEESQNHEESIYSAYPPPEYTRSENRLWGQKGDVWCIGLVVLQMALGSASAKVHGFSRRTNSIVPAIPKTLSESLQDFITGCLRENPQDRSSVQCLVNHAFLEEDPLETTNKMLSDVCNDLDSTMKRLHAAMPTKERKPRNQTVTSPIRRNQTITSPTRQRPLRRERNM